MSIAFNKLARDACVRTARARAGVAPLCAAAQVLHRLGMAAAGASMATPAGGYFPASASQCRVCNSSPAAAQNAPPSPLLAETFEADGGHTLRWSVSHGCCGTRCLSSPVVVITGVMAVVAGSSSECDQVIVVCDCCHSVIPAKPYCQVCCFVTITHTQVRHWLGLSPNRPMTAASAVRVWEGGCMHTPPFIEAECWCVCARACV